MAIASLRSRCGTRHLFGAGNKKSRANEQQLKHLAEYMASHTDFAVSRRKGSMGKEQLRKGWEQLASALNKMGTQKSVAGWQKAWKNQCSLNRSRNAGIKRAVQQPEKPSHSPRLSHQEALVISAIKKELSQGLGLLKAGFIDESNKLEDFIEVEEIHEYEPSTVVDYHEPASASPTDTSSVERKVMDTMETTQDLSKRPEGERRPTLSRHEELKQRNDGLHAIAEAINNFGTSLVSAIDRFGDKLVESLKTPR